MKKLFLLLAGGVSVIAANAQENQSVVFNHRENLPAYTPARMAPKPKPYAGALAKTTFTNSAWFSFSDAGAGSSNSLALYPIYNDSTLQVHPTTGSPFNWYVQGLGTSFDPTSPMFSLTYFINSSPIYPMPTFLVDKTIKYTVDSISILGYYDRKPYNNYVDTLNIYVAVAPIGGAVGVAPFSGTDANLGIPDNILHFMTLSYDSSSNSILPSKVPTIIKIQKILDTTAYADSVGQSTHFFTFPISLTVPANGKIACYQQYISGHKYAVNSNIDSVNTWQVLCYEHNGQGTFPSQFQTDYNSGLIMTAASRYDVDTQALTNAGNQYIYSTYVYGAAAGFDDPFFGFHVNCTTCNTNGVANVSTIASSSAYPNPASSEVYIPFTLSHSANVNVTVANTLGQVKNTQSFSNVTSGKAAFNTSSFAAGVYFYTVEANGERTTGRFVVAR